jgi:hypothetical protein
MQCHLQADWWGPSTRKVSMDWSDVGGAICMCVMHVSCTLLRVVLQQWMDATVAQTEEKKKACRNLANMSWVRHFGPHCSLIFSPYTLV